MFANALRVFLVVTLAAGAQEGKQPGKPEPPAPRDDYREFFKKPETTAEFWRAIRFEIEVGRFDLAAKLLHVLVEKKPDDKELLEIERKEGMSAFLRLLTIPQWDKDPKVHDQALKDAQQLVNQVSAALERHLGDPGRIDKFVRNLSGDREERAYALQELYKSGPRAVPRMVDALRTAEGAERVAILSALPRLGKDTVPPLLAALDIDDPDLRVDLLDVLHQRGAREAVPFLWYLSASPRQPDRVRQKATAALAYLLETPAGKLPSAKSALLKEADRYYRHQVAFADPQAVTIWRWDGKQLAPGWPDAKTVPATKAEEYYGLRFAGQALDLDPAYQPAQILFLSLALEKAVERAGFERASILGAPGVSELIYTINPELVITILDRALAEHRLPVILGAVRALGDLADVRSARPTGHGSPALVRALSYPDRRVQFAAAEALLRIPGRQTPATPTRVVEVLRRAAAIDPAAKAEPKVLVAFANPDVLDKVGDALAQAGFEPVKVQTGREAFRRLNESADIDALLLDSAVPDPGLSSLLGQLRADTNAGRLPVLVAAPRGRELVLRSMVEGYRNVGIVPEGLVLDAEGLKRSLGTAFAEAGSPPLSEAERREYAARAVGLLGLLATGRPPGYDIRPAADTLLGVLRSIRLSEGPMISAIMAAGQLPGPQAQTELANLVLDAKRPGSTPDLRFRAALELARHIQQHGLGLTHAQVKALEDLRATEPEGGLKSGLGLVLGSMRPDARLTGERLKTYTPQPIAPEPPKEKEKEPEKEKEKP